MNLSEHFTLDELTFSQTAARNGIDNTPDARTIEALKLTCAGLEQVREVLQNRPIFISSGYRCAELNVKVGGQPGSQHLLGQAVDFTCPSFGNPRAIVQHLVESNIQFDQCIVEFDRWVHISFSNRNRRHALVIDKNGTREFA